MKRRNNEKHENLECDLEARSYTVNITSYLLIEDSSD